MSKDTRDTTFPSFGILGKRILLTVIFKTLTSPIDRVQFLLQTQEANPQLVGKKYTGIWDCVTRISGEEGFLALFRGNLPKLLKLVPTNVLNFVLKDTYDKIFFPYRANTEFSRFLFGNLLSGAAAGATTLAFVYPLDLAQTRLAVDIGRTPERQFKGMIDCLTQIYKSDGYKGLYRGFGAAVLHPIVFRACFFGGYDTGKRILLSEGRVNILHKFALAQLAYITSSAISYPLDTVRRRLMMQSGRSDIVYKGALGCISQIYRNEGGRGFYGGFLLSLRSFSGSLMVLFIDELYGGHVYHSMNSNPSLSLSSFF